MIAEFDLRKPVASWMYSRDLIPIIELYSLNNCDMAGVKFSVKPIRVDYLIAVELKLKAVAEVIRQATEHRGLVSECWVAMPPISRKCTEKIVAAGLGLLEVDGEYVRVVRESPVVVATLDRWKCLWRRRNEHVVRFRNHQMRRKGKSDADSIRTT